MKIRKILSDIQIQILTKLLRSQGLSYSQARPFDVENDLYNYHLQFLVKKGYLEKHNKIYTLSNKGKKFILNIDSFGRIKELFRVSVLPYVVRVHKGKKEILAHKRTRQPYLGDIESVAGRVKLAERIEEAAKRKLMEETGLEADFNFIGIHRKIRRDNNKKIIEDTFYHVLYGENPNGKLIEKNEFGENSWIDFPSMYKMQKNNITASPITEKILKRIEKKDLSLFYFQEEMEISRF